MAGKKWQAGGKATKPAAAAACLLGVVVLPGRVYAASNFAPSAYVGAFDPNTIREILMGGLAVVFFLAAIIVWAMSALRSVQRAQRRNAAFVSSALNSMTQGIVMVDQRGRLAFCNDSYLQMYGLTRADLSPGFTGRQLAELRHARGTLGCEVNEYFAQRNNPEGFVTELPNGRAISVKHRTLRGGGMVSLHDDCSAQRDLSNQLATTKKFLESVIDNVPVCIAAKSIEDGRYILANRAFERFARLSRESILGKRANDIFSPATASTIEAADRSAILAPDGQFRSELAVERGADKR